MDANKNVKINPKDPELEPIKSEQKIDLKKSELEDKTVSVEKTNKTGFFLGVAIIILAGILSGYFLSQGSSSKNSMPGVTNSEKVVGLKDAKAFPDIAEGTLETGGINGEGTHKLIRPGGDSQTVYLTSSVIDLDQFTGKKVKVWGETLTAEKAGWFMDVGLVENLE